LSLIVLLTMSPLVTVATAYAVPVTAMTNAKVDAMLA
jgi:hypothetical protein